MPRRKQQPAKPNKPADTPKGDNDHNGSAKEKFVWKPRVGAPKGNTNAIRHGLRCGQLPKDARHVEIQCNILRRTLEAAVLQCRHEITIYDAAIIQTAVKYERHGALCLRWLRIEGSKLKPLERLQFSREIAKASTERDRAIAQLGLDRDEEEDVFDVMYKQLPAPNGDTDEAKEQQG